ncbi:unnamed protein product [Ostreobium quekettii]|uniref:MAT1 centre domain-containing protein n=1 Tax=Ostreobium quekettii TaxID=121088 RepID=A0A8S1JF90_9CHLO|nr:unnamed protein product [Ostreobium quekettii]
MDTLKKELQVRSRIMDIFNKREDEFPSKKEFNDFLEEREDIIFNLTQGIDTAAMELKVAEYKRKNQSSIHENRIRKLEDQRAKAEPAQRQGVAAELLKNGATSLAKAGDVLTYKPSMPTASFVGGGPQPSANVISDRDIKQNTGPMTSEQWDAMASASGWRSDTYVKFATDYALDSLF